MDDRVRLVEIAHGPEFEIDLSRFTDAEPAFAYVDDFGGGVTLLHGLTFDGRITIPDRPPFMWLKGPRDCVLVRPTAEGTKRGKVSFRSQVVGEFCVEIFLVRRDGSVERIHQSDFCLK